MNYRKLTALLLCSLAFWACDSRAETSMGVHLASVHVPDNGRVNNTNPGAFVRFDNGFTAGGYHNSLRKTSVYAGYTAERGVFGLTVGAVTGYGNLKPLAALHIKSPVQFLGLTPQLTYIPGHLAKSADVWHFSTSWSIR